MNNSATTEELLRALAYLATLEQRNGALTEDQQECTDILLAELASRCLKIS
jgi:hypothetical protein